jgi:DNA-binding response OmpR family regulator
MSQPVDSTTPSAASARKRVLVVEDEPHIRELVVLHLGLDGLVTVEARAGDEALRAIDLDRFDLIVLDLMLPKIDGITVCRAIRRHRLNADVPILMLTAKREESDKVLGLDSGADDYLTKPFGVRELVARARALLRRPRASQLVEDSTPTPDVVSAGLVRLDRPRRQAHLDSKAIELTPHEFDVLYLLAAHPGIVFTREMLLERVWKNDTHVTERSVDTLIKRLRQKIEVDTGDPQLILTVWGTGYKFNDA